jgi:hypothetical protein
MTAIAGAPRFSPELRATAFYFTIYMSSGAATVFAGIWLQQKGMSSEQIGIINAVPVLVMLVLNLAVGRIADRADDWRQVIVMGALAAGVIPIGLFFVHDFWGILLFWTLAAIPIASIGPVADAANDADDAAQRHRLRGDPGLGHGRLHGGDLPHRLPRGVVRPRYLPAAVHRAGGAARPRFPGPAEFPGAQSSADAGG